MSVSQNREQCRKQNSTGDKIIEERVDRWFACFQRLARTGRRAASLPAGYLSAFSCSSILFSGEKKNKNKIKTRSVYIAAGQKRSFHGTFYRDANINIGFDNGGKPGGGLLKYTTAIAPSSSRPAAATASYQQHFYGSIGAPRDPEAYNSPFLLLLLFCFIGYCPSAFRKVLAWNREVQEREIFHWPCRICPTVVNEVKQTL